MLIFATLMTAGLPSGKASVAKIDDATVSTDVELSSAAPESAPIPRRAAAPEQAPAPPALLRTASLSYAPSVAPDVEATPVSAAARESTLEPTPEPRQPEPEQTVAMAATIAGCLAREDDRFVLKNVSGEDAPKSRSWKSGFLRKRSPSIVLIDGAGTNRLAPYVGRRIETNGLLEDREMHVKSLRVQGACD